MFEGAKQYCFQEKLEELQTLLRNPNHSCVTEKYRYKFASIQEAVSAWVPHLDVECLWLILQ